MSLTSVAPYLVAMMPSWRNSLSTRSVVDTATPASWPSSAWVIGIRTTPPGPGLPVLGGEVVQLLGQPLPGAPDPLGRAAARWSRASCRART